MDKVMTVEQAILRIQDGATVMIGGFGGNGSPHTLIDALVKSNVKDLTIICNDAGEANYGVGKLITNQQVKKLRCTITGPNHEAVEMILKGEIDCELIPQGSFTEKIRAGGFGLGGVLTKTGLGTLVEEGKQKITVNGEEYLVEEPIKADFALIYASKGDRVGNAKYYGSSHTHTPSMAAAAEYTILEVGELFEVGGLSPDEVMTQQILVDAVVVKGA